MQVIYRDGDEDVFLIIEAHENGVYIGVSGPEGSDKQEIVALTWKEIIEYMIKVNAKV